MAEISDVPGIIGSTLELLREAGIETAEALTARDAPDILNQLAVANQKNEIPVRLPSETLVRTWQNAARSLLRRRGQTEALPAATEVEGAALEAAGIEVTAMPVAKVVADVSGSAPLGRVEDRPASRAEADAGKAVGDAPAPGRELPSTVPLKQMPAAANSSGAREPNQGAGSRSQRAEAKPVSVTQRAAPLAGRGGETNRPGESAGAPQSTGMRFRQLEVVQRETPPAERRNRGMSHPDAGRVRFAAVVTVLCLVTSTAAALTLAAALVMGLFYGWHFEWTIALLLLIFPAALFFYLGIGTKVRCRLCGQRLFVPKHCHKHERARRSIFGHTFAVARDASFLASFRCMLCGTKTRLKD